ncbi:hypothetical protein SAMN03159306_01081 [Pseudomonas sp. NFACC48-1]|nr:hypothetical protein SAMN03159306_01081 [Pseudomonas sp. NFACC48-1]
MARELAPARLRSRRHCRRAGTSSVVGKNGAAAPPSGSKLPRHKRSMVFQSGSSPALCRHPMHGRSPMSWASELLWRGSLLPLGCAANATVAGLKYLQWLGKTEAAAPPSGSKLPRHKRSMVFQSGSSPALCRHPMHGRSPMSWASELLWRGSLLPLGCAADATVAGLEHLQWFGENGGGCATQREQAPSPQRCPLESGVMLFTARTWALPPCPAGTPAAHHRREWPRRVPRRSAPGPAGLRREAAGWRPGRSG